LDHPRFVHVDFSVPDVDARMKERKLAGGRDQGWVVRPGLYPACSGPA
jgi:hypothetical protein